MKINKPFLAGILCLNIIGIVNAQNRDDHLEPVGGIFDILGFQFEYYSKVRKVLLNGLSNSPEIRFQVLPSFSPENVLDIEFDRNNNKYYIVYHICEEMIWNNPEWEKVTVRKFKIEVDKESVKLIKTLFSKAIAQVRYPPTMEEGELITMGSDGENYYFTVKEYGYGIKSGTVWSPYKGTKMEKLVDIGNKLINLAKYKKETVKFDEKLQQEIEELINLLK